MGKDYFGKDNSVAKINKLRKEKGLPPLVEGKEPKIYSTAEKERADGIKRAKIEARREAAMRAAEEKREE
jgi:hypothetical protein